MTAGVVLAGGASLRMGVDKALLQVEGVALAARVAAVLRAGGCADVHLVGPQAGLGALGWPVLPEDDGGPRHPLRGVVLALRHFAPRPVLFSPCDQVALETEDIHALLAHGGPVVAEAAGAVQPLVALLHAQQLGEARSLLASGGPARALTQHLPRVQLPERAAVNLNRRGDLEAWLDRGRYTPTGGKHV